MPGRPFRSSGSVQPWGSPEGCSPKRRVLRMKSVPEPEAVPEPEVVPDPEPEPAPAPAPAPGKATAGYLWETDIPGSKVSNILSAISLNDRVLFINVLFREDARLFRDTVAALNSMQGFGEAKQYIMDRFRDWNLSSETVYRLMMAVRRKFQ